MLNTTNITHRDNHSVSVDAKDKHLSLQVTNQDTHIIHCKVKSDCFKYLMDGDPFLYRGFQDVQEVPDGEPYQDFRDKYRRSWTGWVQPYKEQLHHGVTILQVQINGDDALIEYKDRQCEPKTIKTFLKEAKCPDE